MSIETRQWQILKAIEEGKKPEDIKPPLKDGFEKEFFEENKAVYDRLTKQGVKVAWSPIFD